MKTGKLILLAVVAAALAFGAFKAYQKKTESTVKDDGGRAPGATLLPQLAKRVEEIARVEFAKGDKKIALAQDDQHNWTIATSDNYPADPKRITEVVFNLTGLQVAEMVTSREEKYERFGLKGEVGEEGTLTILDKSGKAIATFVRGQERSGENGPEATTRPGGRYVRIPPDPRVYLINEPYYRLGVSTIDWIDAEVMATPSADVVMLAVDHATTESFSLTLDDKESLTLKDIPKGMKVKPYEISATRDALDPLRIENVISAESETAKGLDFKVSYKMKVKDGTVYKVRSAETDGKQYIALSSEYDAPIFLANDKKTTVTMATAEKQADAAKEAVAGFNEKHAPWVYQVSDWTGKRFKTKRSSLLEPVKEKEADKPKAKVTKKAKSASKKEKAKAAPKKTAAKKNPEKGKDAHAGHDHGDKKE